MRWRQFLTSVESVDVEEAREYMVRHSPSDYVMLDVRQPAEYETGHIPGAKLIPLPELVNRIDEINHNIPVIVYCASGGRSRSSAQFLSGRGYDNVYNLSGGFKAWTGKAAYGNEFDGLNLFAEHQTPEEILLIAHSLEKGLEDFYLTRSKHVNHEKTKALFNKLAKVEVKHQAQILKEYQQLFGKSVSDEAIEHHIQQSVIEGGMTTEEYAALFYTDWNNPEEVLELAMSIEAQAYDLYVRAADRQFGEESRKALLRIADEERLHLLQLGGLIEKVMAAA